MLLAEIAHAVAINAERGARVGSRHATPGLLGDATVQEIAAGRVMPMDSTGETMQADAPITCRRIVPGGRSWCG